MVKRRRTTRNAPTRKRSSKNRVSRRAASNKSLKEKFLTTAIWGLSLINIALIISLVSNFFASPNDTPVNTVPAPSNERITVEVLNACGVQGLANQVTEFLRNKNFDVVNVGNYSGGFDLDRTFVFDRVSLENVNAKKVGAALGVEKGQVAPQLDDSLQLMVTVLIGKDYRELKIFDEQDN